jgi:hypothetical protein
MRPSLLCVLLVAQLWWVAPAGSPAAPEPSPPRSILFASPQPLGQGWVDLDLMRTLHNGSWAADGRRWSVDFTTSLAELNRSRLFRYNALVLFISPAAAATMDRKGVGLHLPPVSPSLAAEFGPAVRDYVAAGGGVLLYPSEMNWATQQLYDLTSHVAIGGKVIKC